MESVVQSFLLGDRESLLAPDLYVLCSRFYKECGREIPQQLDSLTTFTAHLRSLHQSSIEVNGDANDCEVKLMRDKRDSGSKFAESGQAASMPASPDPYTRTPGHAEPHRGNSDQQVADLQHDSGEGCAEGVDQTSMFEGLPPGNLSEVRRRVCLCIVDFVLSSERLVELQGGVELGDVRNLALQHLVRVPPLT